MMEKMPAIMLKSYTVYSEFSRNPLTSLETHRRKSQHSDGIKPYTPRQEEPPAWSMSPGGGSLLLSGDVLRGLGSPGKAMVGETMVQDPGPRGEGHMPQGQEQGGKRSYLPRELRIKLYDEVNRLRRDELTHVEIIEEIQRRYGVRLSKSHISYWLRGIHGPYNGRYIPSIEFLRPSEELAYVIGVEVGDGYVARRRRAVKSYNRVRIGLKVKDREFAAEFGRCLAKVLGRQPIKPKHSSRQYIVEVHSQTLYELLKKPVDLDRLKKYIEHCERCMRHSLEDSRLRRVGRQEGLHIYLQHRLGLLEYVKDLLKHLGIESTGPWPKRRQVKTFYDPRTNEKIHIQKG
jgi:intein-encoded DNA endonuclease-like protein